MLNRYIRIMKRTIFILPFVLLFCYSGLNAAEELKTKDRERAILDYLGDKAKEEAAKKEGIQEELKEAKEEVEKPRWEVDSYAMYIPAQDAEAMSGDVAITQSGSECSYKFKAFDKLPVELYLGTKYIGINDTVSVSLPSYLTELSFGIDTTLPFFKVDKTYLRLGMTPSLYGDRWHFNSTAFRIPAYSLLIYQPKEQLIFLLGIAVSPGCEDSVIPVGGLVWQPNNKLSFNIIPDRPNISYDINDKLTLFAEGFITSEEYKVKKDNLKTATLAYNENRFGGGVTYQINKFIECSLSGGGVFGRTLKYRDSLGKVHIKDGAYTELRIDILM